MERFRQGKHLPGKDGSFLPLLKEFLDSALQALPNGHLDPDERLKVNQRNGTSKKLLRTSDGSFELETPRDWNGTFEPEIVKKRETIFADHLEDNIIGLYGLGKSLRDISDHIGEMYGPAISVTTLSEITDRIIPGSRNGKANPWVKCIVLYKWMPCFAKSRPKERL